MKENVRDYYIYSFPIYKKLDEISCLKLTFIETIRYTNKKRLNKEN